jgi:hypothetical protein
MNSDAELLRAIYEEIEVTIRGPEGAVPQSGIPGVLLATEEEISEAKLSGWMAGRGNQRYRAVHVRGHQVK